MLKKVITYTDYDGVERTETFNFNFTKAEVAEMEMSTEGGLAKKIEKIVEAKDQKEIIALFKEIVLNAYGEKTADGRRFVKSQEIRDAFAQTEAFSELFMELATNTDAAIAFLNGIIPQVPAKS